jgi:deoxyadenosine/deoxycytidine kinase
MSTRDFENYFTLFNMLGSLIQPPDLVIYLRASVPTLVKQIQKRGRKYEDNIRLDYLKRLNERYEAWIQSYKLGRMLIVEADHYNFPNNNDHLSEVIDKINAELHGLF